MDQTTDGNLVRRVLDVGDNTAYSNLVERYQGHVYGLAFSILGNWADAQDVAQDTFIRAYVNLGTLENHEKFASWLRRIAFSTCMDFIRQHRPGLFQQMGSPADLDQLQLPQLEAPPQEVLEQMETAEAVLRAVAALPAKYRIPLTMFHLDGLSYQKVAEFLDVPLGTAKSLIHHAKRLLKPALAAYAPEVWPMVEEVFHEHKLHPSFNDRVQQMIKAAAHGDVPTVRALAKADAALVNASIPTWWNGSALGKAIAGNWIEVVQTLLDLGADPTARDAPFGQTALQFAFIGDPGGHPLGGDAIKLLLDRCRPLDIFHAAVVGDEGRVAEMLAGDPSLAIAKDANGWEAILYCAISQAHKQSAESADRMERIARMLLKSGADPNVVSPRNPPKQPWDLPVLYYALCHSGNLHVARALLEAGSKPDLKESLFHCLSPMNARGLALLAEFKIDLNARVEGSDHTILWTFSQKDDSAAVDWLLSNGADPNLPSESSGETPLHAACRFGSPKAIVELLVRHGANLNAKDSSGDWPLAIVLREGHDHLVTALIALGSDEPSARARLVTVSSAGAAAGVENDRLADCTVAGCAVEPVGAAFRLTDRTGSGRIVTPRAFCVDTWIEAVVNADAPGVRLWFGRASVELLWKNGQEILTVKFPAQKLNARSTQASWTPKTKWLKVEWHIWPEGLDIKVNGVSHFSLSGWFGGCEGRVSVGPPASSSLLVGALAVR